MAQTRLTPVEIEEVSERSGRAQSALTGLLLTGLRLWSQRALDALASLADLLLLGSAFALWLLVIAAPTTPQLIGVVGYAVFVLIALLLRRRA